MKNNIRNINVASVVLDEDVEIIRSIIRAEVYCYRNSSCVLTMGLSSDGKRPITHWTSSDVVTYENYLQISKVNQYLKSKNIYFIHSIKYDFFHFYSFLEPLNLKFVTI